MSKKVLFINLDKLSYEVKTFPDLEKYIGGMGLGLKIYEQHKELDPIIFSVGPLNGYFPYASKTSVILQDGTSVEDLYLGGYLSTRIKFTEIDSIAVYGKSKEEVVISIQDETVLFKDMGTEPGSLGLPGKRCSLFLDEELKKVVVDGYFQESSSNIYRNLKKKRVFGISVTGTKVQKIKNVQKYEELYEALLGKSTELTIEKGFFPSCSGCPMGCERSHIGEIGGNVLSHSMVACKFAENIYSDIGTVFSCLNVLGYNYTHEDIENLPILIENTLKELI